MEAKLCPDGSYVSRVGLNCEFAPCPLPKATATPVAPPPPAAAICPQFVVPCPDGSYVKPEGPNCKVPACPTSQSTDSGIQGKMLLGPICPVMQNPPDPNCPDKPYQGTVVVRTSDRQKEITRFTAKADGTFKVSLAPGTYFLDPVNPPVYPRGSPRTVTVNKNQYTQVNISYDTGIR